MEYDALHKFHPLKKISRSEFLRFDFPLEGLPIKYSSDELKLDNKIKVNRIELSEMESNGIRELK